MVRLRIDLEVEGDEQDALHVVNHILDVGLLQDAINEHIDVEDAGALRVKSATVSGKPADKLYKVSFRSVVNGTAAIHASSQGEAVEMLSGMEPEDVLANVGEVDTEVVSVIEE